ncbi:MAG: Flp pilus assembly protein CpaB [Chloroflexi bacterium]|nr:Flp pilus assembly protein CpaB [Chloroflexota bacterium]
MRGGGRILVLLGLVLGMITAGGTFVVMNSSVATTEKPATKMVVVAQQNIAQRSEIPPEAIVLKEWPESSLPQSGTFETLDKVLGKLALVPIYPGQLILEPMIVDKTDAEKNRSDASFLVPEGKVAVAFPMTDLSGVAGALQVGDVIDVLLTLNPGSIPPARTAAATTTGTEGLPATQLMLQNVQILQVGAWQVKDKNQPAGPLLTFLLSRQDALALKSAREQGIIELVLRPALKDKEVEFKTESVTLQYLNRRFNFNLAPASNR